MAGSDLHVITVRRSPRIGCPQINQTLTLSFLIAVDIGLVVQNILTARTIWASSTVLIAMLLNSLAGTMLLVSILQSKQGLAGSGGLVSSVRWWTFIPGLSGSSSVSASISEYQNVGAATTIVVLVVSQLIGGPVLDILHSHDVPLRVSVGPVYDAVLLVIGAQLVARRSF